MSADEKIRHLEPEKLREGQALLAEETPLLAYEYPPDTKASQSFLFAVRRNPEKRMLFKVGIWPIEDLANANPTWDFYTWDSVCGERPAGDTAVTPARQPDLSRKSPVSP